MKNKAILVSAEDYEGLYVNGRLVSEGETLEEGEERVLHFLELSKKYEFDIYELEFSYCSNEDNYKIQEIGNMYQDINEFIKIIKIRGA